MLKWWNENGPPVYVAVAAYLGLVKERPKTKKSTGSSKSGNTGDLNELAAMFRSSGGMIQ